MVDPWEAMQQEPSPTYAVVEHINAVLSKAEKTKRCSPKIIFVCGADLVHAMLNPAQWPPANLHRLLRTTTLAVYPRQGIDNASDSLRNEEGDPVKVIKIAADVDPNSSTLVR